MNRAQELVQEAIDNGTIKLYKKFGIFKGRKAKIGEKIDTIINGVKETANTAGENYWVLTGAKGEQYLLSETKLRERYSPVTSTTGPLFEATGETYATQYRGTAFEFVAPWGESMLCEFGDFICTTAVDNLDDVYRIESSVFADTYR